MLKRMDIEELRKDLEEALRRADEGERIVVRRKGRAIAALVPVEDAKLMDRAEDAYWVREAEEALEEMKRTGEKPIPWEEVQRRLDEANARKAAPKRRKSA